jgi:hypothetical protein
MFPLVALTQDKSGQPGPCAGVEQMLLPKHETTGGGGTFPVLNHPELIFDAVPAVY